MFAQSPTARFAPQSHVATAAPVRRRGVLGALAALIEKAGRAEAESSSDSESYWTSIARGL